MLTNLLLRKGLILGIISLFVGINFIFIIRGDPLDQEYEIGLGNLTLTPMRTMARTPTGDVYVVYYRYDGSYNQIYMKKSTDNGVTWNSEEKVHNESANQNYPLILIDSQDRINVIYKNGIYGSEYTGPLYFKRKVGDIWENRELISSNVTEMLFEAVLDANDDIHVLYSDDSRGCYYRERSNGRWGDEEVISNGSIQRAEDITVDNDGNIHAFFDSSPDQYYVLKHRERMAGNWGLVTIIGQTDNGANTDCSVATDDAGNIHVVWRYRIGTSNAICHREYSNGWQPNIDYIQAPIPYFQDNPSISTDSNNYLHVVWQGKYNDSPTYCQIRHCQYTDSWGTVENLTNATTDQSLPDLIWGLYPEVNGAKINRPENGYAFVWNDDSVIKFYKSADLAWENGGKQLRFPVDNPLSGLYWTHVPGSPGHIPSGGMLGADDTYALDLNWRSGSDDQGKPVYSIENGTIRKIIRLWGWVLIEHNTPLVWRNQIYDTWYSGYLHMQKIPLNLREEDSIVKSTQIGEVGKMMADSPHLHFAIYIGKIINGRYNFLESVDSGQVGGSEYTFYTYGDWESNYWWGNGAVYNHNIDDFIEQKPPNNYFEKEGSENDWFETTNYGFYDHIFCTHTTHSSEQNWGKWHLTIPMDGKYSIYTFIPRRYANTRKANYQIFDNDILKNATLVSQLIYNDKWVKLGSFDFKSGDNIEIRLSDNTGEFIRYIAYDTVKIWFKKDITLPRIN